MPLCPRNVLERRTEDGTRRIYRWVRDLACQDSEQRRWQLHALECAETPAGGATTRFVWLRVCPSVPGR